MLENQDSSINTPSADHQQSVCGVFVGSFDPFHAGHRSVADRALRLFDRLVIGVGVNPEKHYMFSAEQRVEAIAKVFANEPRITVESYSGLTIDFALRHDAQFLVKGVRNASDFLYEQQQAEWNKRHGGIDTVILFAEEELKTLSSTQIKATL